MAENKITPEDIASSMQALLDQLSDGRASTLAQFAEAHEKRATRLAGAEARLKARLGDDHPRVMALRRAVATTNELKTSLRTTATREARRPKIGPHEWLVFGRVLDPTGHPVSGLRVRVFDRDRKYDDLLGDTITDEFGDFRAIYHERDFAEMGEALPELYVMVSDAKGNVLYTSRDTAWIKAGRAEYFEIVLGQELAPEAPPPKPRPSPKGTAEKDKTIKSKRRASPKG